MTAPVRRAPGDTTGPAPKERRGDLVALVARRLRERRFWIVQTGILTVTVLHVLFEALSQDAVARGDLSEGLHHIPVALYVLPVAYAGLAYGFEGGVLTGLLSAALVAPSIPLWHAQDFAWLGELLFVAVVIGTGTVLSLPVERERRQRLRSERAARRLALVSEVTIELAGPGDLQTRAGATLERVTDALEADGAWLALRRRKGGEPVVVTGSPPSGPLATELERAARSGGDSTTSRGAGTAAATDTADAAGPSNAEDTVFITPVQVDQITGALAVAPGVSSLSPDDRALIATVGRQLGIAVENALLHRDEAALLQSYVRATTTAQEEERKRIARELHDESAQELALLSRSLDDLGGRLHDHPAEADRAAELRDRTRSTLEGIRRFSRDLRPTVLDDFGLMPALEWLVSEIGERSDLDAELVAEGSPRRLAPEKETVLFRITQEALRNVERHAKARRVEVRCRFGPHSVQVRIVDDGQGFEVPAEREPVAAGHLGLMGIRERAQLVGGSVQITSTPGEGTEIAVEIDADADAAERNGRGRA